MCSDCVPVDISVTRSSLTFGLKVSKQITLDPILVMDKLSLLCTAFWLALLFPWWQLYHPHQGFQP